MSISLYVSPDGNDQNTGTIDAPLATLHQARQTVRERIASFKPGEEQDVDIHLAAGTHRLSETLVLDHRDSGSDAFKVSWKGADGGGTILSSGHPLTGWRKLEDEPAWLAPAARGRVWYTDLPADSRITTLYGAQGLVPRAKGEGFSPLKLSEVAYQVQAKVYGPDAPIPIPVAGPYRQALIKHSHHCFAFPEGAIAEVPDLHEAECLIIPVNQWTMNILPVERVDFDGHIVHLAQPCTYPIGVPHCAPHGSIWLENSLSVLKPGSWVFHRASARLYYCPEGDEPEAGLEASLLTEFIRVEGRNDAETGLRPVRQVHFSGIEFTHSGRFGFHGLTGKGIQHDWEMHDLPYTGIVCSGRTVYDREGYGECSGTIDWDAVDAQCGKGHIHNVWHYSGITSWWMREPLMHSRDNLIEYNRIRDVMQIMGDGNGIYVSGAGGGNVVRYNAVGPCPSPSMAEGIRCDDDQHHTLIHGNLIFGQGGMATGITLKGINRVTNNILALPAVEQTARGMLSLETGPLNGTVFAHNIIYTSTIRQRFVSEMRIHGAGREARLRDTESDHNIYHCTADPGQGAAWIAEQQGYGNDYDSRACDPGFVDAERGDFNLKPDAAALKSGFKHLPLERMMAIHGDS